MRRSLPLAGAALLGAAGACAGESATQAAASALGVNGLETLSFAAEGERLEGGQMTRTSEPWLPVRMVRSYQASFDYPSHGMRVDEVRSGSSSAGYFAGEDHIVQLVSGGFAWNEPEAQAAVPQPGWLQDRQLLAWAGTPQGVLKAAAGATARAVTGGTELLFKVGGAPVKAFIDELNLLERVETITPDVLLGDVPVVIRYSSYRDFGGIRFPGLIVESEAGFPVLFLAVTEVKANPTLQISVPENIRAYIPPAVTVKTQKLADGVYWLFGSSHHSMAVDMGDYVVMVEAPLNEVRSQAVMAETRRLIPDKPIRYVINTHLHSDHSGGLRTYVDAGATVVTQSENRAFYERAWSAPRTLEPDRLSRSGKPARFLTVQDAARLKGGNGRVLELHLLQGNPHNEQNLVVWLPTERILFQSDMLNAPVSAPVTHPGPVITNFYDNLRRLKIEPQQIVGGHGPKVLTMSDLDAAAGRAEEGH
ncbi:MAG TPA: MBL fold metallo-hydrolase [Mycobacterium sp.]|nr:MBL fold metallo-hydrolase [Mycobacterium sp.]